MAVLSTSGVHPDRRWGARLLPPDDDNAHLATACRQILSTALRLCEAGLQAYHVLPYFLAKLTAELPVGAVFPLLFGLVVYPLTGLNPKPSRRLFPSSPPVPYTNGTRGYKAGTWWDENAVFLRDTGIASAPTHSRQIRRTNRVLNH